MDLARVLAVSLLAFACACEQPGTPELETDAFPDTSGMTSSMSVGTDTTMSTGPTSAAPTSDPTSSSEPTASSDASGETGSPLCGNMAVDPGEDCDDGNDVQADECNTDCSIPGTMIWEHVHASGLGTDYIVGVAVDEEGDAYVGGAERVADATAVAWIRKYSRQGGLEWTRTIDGTAAGDDFVYGMGGGPTDIVAMGTLVNASTGEDIMFARYDVDGNQAWQNAVTSAMYSSRRRT